MNVGKTLFAQLMDDARYRANLYGDISAITQGNRMSVVATLLERLREPRVHVSIDRQARHDEGLRASSEQAGISDTKILSKVSTPPSSSRCETPSNNCANLTSMSSRRACPDPVRLCVSSLINAADCVMLPTCDGCSPTAFLAGMSGQTSEFSQHQDMAPNAK